MSEEPPHDDQVECGDASGHSDHEADEEEELSGCDDENYAPFPMFPGVFSQRKRRLEAFQEWIGASLDGSLDLPVQSVDPKEPVKFPLVARFAMECPRQSEEEVAEGMVIHIIVLGSRPTRGGGMYCVFYQGSRLLEHLCNVGSDGRVYPFASLSTLAQLLYGTNCNGWKWFKLCDESSPYHDRALGALRAEQGGPGFENTFDSDLLDEWESIAPRTLNADARYHFDAFIQAVESAASPSGDDDEDSGEEAASKDTASRKPVLKKRPRPIKTAESTGGDELDESRLTKVPRKIDDLMEELYTTGKLNCDWD